MENFGTTEIKCPYCQVDTVYRYGKNRNGKQRFYCLSCSRQFVHGARRILLEDRPDCPDCGKKMYLYRRGTNGWHFRCSGYPECRTYLKRQPEEIR